MDVDFVNDNGQSKRQCLLIDSGSNWNVAKRRGLEPFIISSRPIPKSLYLIGAGGTAILGENICTFRLKMGNQIVESEFYIINDDLSLNYPLLGLSLMRSVGMVLNLGLMTLQFQSKDGSETLQCRSNRDEIIESTPETLNRVLNQEVIIEPTNRPTYRKTEDPNELERERADPNESLEPFSRIIRIDQSETRSKKNKEQPVKSTLLIHT